MDISGLFNYRNIKFASSFLLLTAAIYFASSLLVFVTDLRLVPYSPAGVEGFGSVQQKAPTLPLQREYRSLLDRNLFRIKLDETAVAKESDLMANIDKLALTSLNCTLIGTVIHESGESWAIIKDNQSGRQEKVAVGSMFSGAKVVMILRNKVVLNFNGKDELLVMGIEKIRAENLAKEKGGEETSPGEGSSYKVSRTFVQESMNDLAKIMTTVRIKPFLKDGKPLGFQVSRIKEGSVLATMGFKDMDVITDVNGQNVRSPEDAMRLYNTLKDSSFFTITIVRNDQPMTLNYKVR